MLRYYAYAQDAPEAPPIKGRAFYGDVSDALNSFLPPSLRGFSSYRTSHNIKVWYGDENREHYEVQSIRRRKGYELEIGFHTEHANADRNSDVVDGLVSIENRWRKELGKEPEAGAFVGYQTRTWRRISELWEAVDSPDLAVEAAERLAAYIRALEPLRSATR